MLKSYIYIDGEYSYTCSAREGQVPNYKNIIELLDNNHKDSIKIIYHVGESKKKRGICDFLTRLGVNYNVILEYMYASKTQLVGASMAIDVMIHALTSKNAEFVFLTGDDYLIPIAEELNKRGINIHVYYFPVLLSRELEKNLKSSNNTNLISLSNKFFTYPKQK